MSARSSAVLERRPAIASNELERELLARLGLSTDANTQDLDRAHDELIGFLETAPHDLHGWVERQIAIADEAYVLLSDPTASLAGITIEQSPVVASVAAEIADEAATAPRPATHAPAARAARAALPASLGGAVVGHPVRRVLLAAAGVVAAVAVVFAVYQSGAPAVPGVTGTPAPEASSGAQLDTAQVAQLMEKVQADPTDVASLQALGDLYFQAADYVTSAEWEAKVLALEPRNIPALLGLGAATFNQGNATEAERQWRAVLDIDPLNLEAHYDLGFMYFSQNPPDIERTTAEWNSVIEIAPDSDIARTVATHLETLQSWAASSVPSGSPAAGPSTPASSPAPSAAGSPASSVAP
jgi:cytochrome c-type biogenesis protein CcmH/NrfG